MRFAGPARGKGGNLSTRRAVREPEKDAKPPVVLQSPDMNPPGHPPRSTPRPVVVVLGSGRSGTSLLMQVLAALGLRMSAEMIEARRDNPRGFYEDASIVRVQADLLRQLGAWPYHPLPEDWPEAPATTNAAGALQDVLRDRLGRDARTWGFKDPRTASFLPLWRRVFAAEDVVPRYLLALREPGSIIRSFREAYATDGETAERVWLRRTCDALWHTRADCHIVHYEDWFVRSREVIEGLARFTGLGEAGAAASLETLVSPDLNRSETTGHVLRDPHARALHTALKSCRGDVFDRERLLRTVDACRRHLGPHPARNPAPAR